MNENLYLHVEAFPRPRAVRLQGVSQGIHAFYVRYIRELELRVLYTCGVCIVGSGFCSYNCWLLSVDVGAIPKSSKASKRSTIRCASQCMMCFVCVYFGSLTLSPRSAGATVQ